MFNQGMSGARAARHANTEADIGAHLGGMDSEEKIRQMSGEFDRVKLSSEKADESIIKFTRSTKKLISLAAGGFGLVLLADLAVAGVSKLRDALENLATKPEKVRQAMRDSMADISKMAEDTALKVRALQLAGVAANDPRAVQLEKDQRDAGVKADREAALKTAKERFEANIKVGMKLNDAAKIYAAEQEQIYADADKLQAAGYQASAQKKSQDAAERAKKDTDEEKRRKAEAAQYVERGVEAAHQAQVDAMSEEDKMHAQFADKRKELEYQLISAIDQKRAEDADKIRAGIEATKDSEARAQAALNYENAQDRINKEREAEERITQIKIDAAEKTAAAIASLSNSLGNDRQLNQLSSIAQDISAIARSSQDAYALSSL